MTCKVTIDGYDYRTSSNCRWVLFCRYDEQQPRIVKRSNTLSKLTALRHQYPRSVIIDTVSKQAV